jgi:hypothetical protein
MRLNRTLLYTGVFVLAVGVALLLADVRQVGSAELIAVLGLWPLAVIGAGIGLIARRSPLSLAGGLLAAALPGLVLGGILALGPRLAVDRGYLHRLEAAYERYHCVDFGARFDFGNVEIDPTGGCR